MRRLLSFLGLSPRVPSFLAPERRRLPWEDGLFDLPLEAAELRLLRRLGREEPPSLSDERFRLSLGFCCSVIIVRMFPILGG